MGYYTSYELTLPNETSPEVVDGIRAMLEDLEVIDYALDRNFCCYDAVKWYDHEEDMIKVSKAFPDVHFCLSGRGEESEDIWECHFKGGKSVKYYAEITIPPFNEADLR